MASYPVFALSMNPMVQLTAAWGDVTERSFSRMIAKPDWGIRSIVGPDGTDHLVDVKDDGSLHLNLDYFHFLRGLHMTNAKFDRLFGGPPRPPETPVEQRHMDVARSIQIVTEEIMLRLARHAREVHAHAFVLEQIAEVIMAAHLDDAPQFAALAALVHHRVGGAHRRRRHVQRRGDHRHSD